MDAPPLDEELLDAYALVFARLALARLLREESSGRANDEMEDERRTRDPA